MVHMNPAYLTWLINPKVVWLDVGTSGACCSVMAMAYLLLLILTLTLVPGLLISLVLCSSYSYPFREKGLG